MIVQRTGKKAIKISTLFDVWITVALCNFFWYHFSSYSFRKLFMYFHFFFSFKNLITPTSLQLTTHVLLNTTDMHSSDSTDRF